MNEQERAEWLARAVDNLIQRREAAEPPEDLDDGDLDGIMRVARARLALAETTAHQGLQYEGAVWQKVLDRLEKRASNPSRKSNAATYFLRKSGDGALDQGEGEDELKGLEDIAALRKRMSDEIVAFAETQREAVWRTVQSRLEARTRKKGLFSFLRRDRAEADALAPALDGIVVGQTVWRATDSRIDDLVELARKRRELGRLAQDGSAGAQHRAWSRIVSAFHSDPQGAPVRHAFTGGRPAWRRLALGAAALALFVAALGPIPATGLANHPGVQFVEDVAQHVGVIESNGPPAEAGAPVVIEGTPVSTADASRLLGVDVSQPDAASLGLELTSSIYYPTGLTSAGGVFLLSYASDDGALLVFQEAASGAGLASGAESARDVTLSDGTAATFFEGGWVPDDAGFTWAAGSARTLVFDRDGARTIIQYSGTGAGLSELVGIADGFR